MKLSPAQRKVLDVMADGTALRRSTRGGYPLRYWDNGSRVSIPAESTVKALVRIGLVEELPTPPFSFIFTIIPKGREALKKQGGE